jgi:hypothetical protein
MASVGRRNRRNKLGAFNMTGNPLTDAQMLNFLEDPHAYLVGLTDLSRYADANFPRNYPHPPAPSSVQEIGCKAAARILLSRVGTTRIVVPDRDEWLGVGLLERDDELPGRR